MEENKFEEVKEKKDWMLPASILIAALVISLALVHNTGKKDLSAGQPGNQETQQVGSPKNVKPFNANDHILGDQNAPVKVIVFSDFECPYCKTFH
jgi:protein-disulfide isomerase